MKVREAMHKGVEWVNRDTPIAEIAKIMRDCDVGALPVGENDRLVGMVTDRDIVISGLANQSFDASRATARDVMTDGIHCCRAEDELHEAVEHMKQLKVRRLPVIDENKRMVGMLSLGDIAEASSGKLVTDFARGVSDHHA